MNINEIINESANNDTGATNNTLDILKNIDSAIKVAYTAIKDEPKLFQASEKNDEDLDEGIRDTLGKAALAGTLALSGLGAQADQIYTQLGTCAGVMMEVGMNMMRNGDPQGQKVREAGGRALLLLNNSGNDGGAAIKAFRTAQTVMQHGSIESYKQGLGMLADCHKTLNTVIQMTNKRQAQYAEKMAAYNSSPQGQYETKQRAISEKYEEIKHITFKYIKVMAQIGAISDFYIENGLRAEGMKLQQFIDLQIANQDVTSYNREYDNQMDALNRFKFNREDTTDHTNAIFGKFNEINQKRNQLIQQYQQLKNQ